MRALIYIVLLLGSSLAAAGEDRHEHGYSANHVCELVALADHSPLPADDDPRLPVEVDVAQARVTPCLIPFVSTARTLVAPTRCVIRGPPAASRRT